MSIAQLASLLAEVSQRLSVALNAPTAALDTLVSATRQALPQLTSVTLTLLDQRGGPTTVAASDDRGRAVDECQYRLGEGPCLSAAITGATVSVPSLVSAPGEWPELARYATGLGVQSVLSVGFPRRTPGSLNLYSSQPRAFADESEHFALALASYATVLVRCAQPPETGSGGRGRRRHGGWRVGRRSGSAGVPGPLLRCPACGIEVVLTDAARAAMGRAGLQCPSRSCAHIFTRAW
jgi:hypothetical protein